MQGKIVCINKSIHRVLLDNGDIIDTTTRGKLRKNNVFPLVGDNVLINEKEKTIEKVLDRKNSLYRPSVANIDKLLIVMSTSIPSFSSYLIDKFLLMSFKNKIEPIIVITKMDLLDEKSKENINSYIKYYKSLNIKVYINDEVNKIKKEFKGSVVSLCGQTGAGKSTLLNKLYPKLELKTGDVSVALGRGKHTTRLVELIKLNDCLIADTPGFSSLELDIEKNDIKKYYPDFIYDCKYRSCIHNKEDGCAIKEQVNVNIPIWRYNNYLKFLEEATNVSKRINSIKKY